jgi:hypothetical protein
MTASRGVVRHDKFAPSVSRLAKRIPRIREIVEGAIWSITRDPENTGVKNPLVGVWQATVIAGDDRDAPRVMIYYVFNRRYVKFLTATLDTSRSN